MRATHLGRQNKGTDIKSTVVMWLKWSGFETQWKNKHIIVLHFMFTPSCTLIGWTFILPKATTCCCNTAAACWKGPCGDQFGPEDDLEQRSKRRLLTNQFSGEDPERRRLSTSAPCCQFHLNICWLYQKKSLKIWTFNSKYMNRVPCSLWTLKDEWIHDDRTTVAVTGGTDRPAASLQRDQNKVQKGFRVLQCQLPQCFSAVCSSWLLIG